jgi:hypothetical protein
MLINVPLKVYYNILKINYSIQCFAKAPIILGQDDALHEHISILSNAQTKFIKKTIDVTFYKLAIKVVIFLTFPKCSVSTSRPFSIPCLWIDHNSFKTFVLKI